MEKQVLANDRFEGSKLREKVQVPQKYIAKTAAEAFGGKIAI